MTDAPTDIDFDKQKPVGDLKTLTNAATRLEEKQKRLKDMDKATKELKKEIQQLESQELPDLMDGCAIKELVLENGKKLSLKSITKASLPTQAAINKEKDEEKKDEMEHRLSQGMKYLRDNEGEEIIKNKFTIEFSKGQDNIVGDFQGKADELGLPSLREESVHNATLSTFVREKMESGKEVPMETLSVYCGRKAEVKKA